MTDPNTLRSTSDFIAETQSETAKLAAENMRDYAIFALDPAGHVASWNAGAQRMKGYRSEDIIGRHFSTFYPREQVESGHPDWELTQAAATGFFIDQGWRLRKDGSRFWAHVVITAQRRTDGSLDGFIKVTRDESEVRARQQRSSKRFNDLMELTPVGIALFDDTDNIIDANGALAELLDYRLRDVYRMTAADLLHPSDTSVGLVPNPSRPPQESQPHRVLARADGQPVLCEVHWAASLQDDGRRFWLVVFQDVTSQVQHAETLHHQATHDETTGLLNRQGVNELLPRLLREDCTVGVLFCDLDNFKRVNDSLGHEAGDELLRVIAQRLLTELPPGCTPARLYGDEYLILCGDVDACGGIESLTEHVEKLLRTVVPLRGRLIRVSASIGAAVAESSDTGAGDLIRHADAAMFETKNRERSSSPNAVSRSVRGQLALEEHLRHSIMQGNLPLHYQPIVDRSGRIVLAEALLRWSPPDGESLSPDIVLRVAEQGGLLRDLDRLVLTTALRESARWPVVDGEPVSIAVNLTGLRPDVPEFGAAVSTAVAECGFPLDRIVLELVETYLADLPAQPRRAMTELTESGVRFAMDDFGTGYSSLARLKDLPTQIIKLDRGFVSGVSTDPTDLGITRAVVEMSRTMGRTCIAEGVETDVQQRILHGLGVDAYQGYLFSAPLPAEAFRELLTRSPLSMPSN